MDTNKMRAEALEQELATLKAHIEEMTKMRHAHGFDSWASVLSKIDLLTNQLNACAIVAMANTKESACEQRAFHPSYMTFACRQVMRAVDAEIELRERLEARADSLSKSLREQFEAWVLREYPNQNMRQFSSGEYCSTTVHHCWLSWQASREAVVVELPNEWVTNVGTMLPPPGVRRAIEAQGLKVAP
ncbi:hypothetical protein [Pseudomonas sp. 25571]|uniref:hypothetical protein n=1 Tax=Pseudomonas sp. 25571 TaxID=2967216 RepID=UPI002363640E|nr:hypothetical protein [Pseudomonas sp. 25571]MDD2062980.1 hypothetical protein [Pseudomonas sp. 25571]